MVQIVRKAVIAGLWEQVYVHRIYISRQKNIYIKSFANAVVNGEIDLENLSKMSNDEVRNELVNLKGIGNWTVDVYLMFTLSKNRYFPDWRSCCSKCFKTSETTSYKIY